jgi:hypothetical protein
LAGLDLTHALARLLTDRSLRRRFRADRSAVSRELSLQPDDAAILCAIDPPELDAQAQSLLAKRLGEVARIAPRTWKALGIEGVRVFDDYASDHWPTGHMRHPHDALAFLRFLTARGLPHDTIETLRLEARLSRCRCRIRLIPRAGLWQLPAIYYGWRTRSGWSERLLHIGPWR